MELGVFEISVVELCLAGVLILAFAYEVYFYLRYMRFHRDAMHSVSTSERPGVTVIVCAKNEAINLRNYIQSLLTQDYPEYELIIVNDGSEDNTQAVIDEYMLTDSRVRTTFVPRDARVRSTKKLGLTLAAKAAKYDFLLLTDADCRPESAHWISEMMKGFENVQGDKVQGTKDIVLGFGAYFYEKGHVNRLVRFDTLFNGLHYLGAALCGHPYMGVGRNLAYRKSFFFESGGFTQLMTCRAGDDDLFVNHVATKKNTAVVLSRESFTWSPSKSTMKEWWQQKRRHLSVSPNYREGTKFRLALEPLTRGLFYILVVAMMILYRPAMQIWPFAIGTLTIPFLAAPALFLLRWIIQTTILNTAARRMRLHRFSMFSVLWFDISLPLVALYMLIVPQRKKNIW